MSRPTFSSTVLAVSRRPTVRRLVTGSRATRGLVDRFVAGDTLPDALAVTADLVADGRLVTLDHLGEDTTDAGQAVANRDAYVALLEALGDLAGPAEVSVKLSALGAALPGTLALDNAAAICAAAERAGTTVTVDMEDHTTVDGTLETVGKLRAEYPWVGAVLQSALRRTEADCRDLADTRVRLVKGAYAEPASVAYQARSEVDAAYERCLDVLLAGAGYPMVGSHDPRMIERALAAGRAPDTVEFQMLYGVRVPEQRRLAAAGHRVRVYTPYGADWYGYFARRLAERPANLGFLLRSLVRSH
ncbi:proline dehydrogenase family protein [Pseudonocardia pini]|uniref:proline dehydrogenase family protein n=1 Tax=Pseudonocardia pini TaxID=2758030 RepID=UPI0015F0056C|nr:proline dehydrogenase family protein [Pseudonocardia pini]